MSDRESADQVCIMFNGEIGVQSLAREWRRSNVLNQTSPEASTCTYTRSTYHIIV